MIGDTSERTILLPICHTTQKANLEVSVSASGEFVAARVLRPDEMTTIIPCTEDSSARTSGLVPHPLADKLQYVAGDYQKFGGEKKPCFALYLENLEAWCSSAFAHPLVKAVYVYLKKGCLIADLLAEKILVAGESGTLMKKWDGEKTETPPIFQSVTGGQQAEAFVRFAVDGVDLSRDTTVWESFIHYYLSCLQTEDTCYVQGTKMKTSMLSPYKIRNAGDRAKLISSNDSANFTYRGRFSTPQQAFSIGYETTQKAHSALRWLIGRQGSQQGDQTVLVWGTQNEPIPPLSVDTLGFAFSDSEGEDDCPWEEKVETFTTRDGFARQFNKVIAGYGSKLDECSQVSVMILDSATPGRLSVRYYRELKGSALLENIKKWHLTYSWLLEYRKLVKPSSLGKKVSFQPVSFVGAPSPEDIAKAAYGENVDDKLKQQTIERLVPCIAEGKLLPRDLMLAATNRATAGIGREPWERRKIIGIACALIRGYHNKKNGEEFTMALDENCKDISYLYGRILACAEQAERYAQTLSAQDPGDKRPTNAERYMVPYTVHPAKTLALLQERLCPYLERIRAKTGKDSGSYALMLRLIDQLPLQENLNARLSELYLLGYASQKIAFWQENQNRKAAESEKD
jgi:CRISPR-associated protein Csd1